MPTQTPFPLASESAAEREVEDLLQRVRDARSEVVDKLRVLINCSESLKQSCRRNPTDLTSSLTLFASAHMRLARAALQGVSRVGLIERVVDRTKLEKVEAQRFEEERLARELARKSQVTAQKQVDRLTFPMDVDAIDELFGEVDSDA